MLVRRCINKLVLVYKWMQININLCDSGEMTCLSIASPAVEDRYYFDKMDVRQLSDNIELIVATEINRYLNKCVVQKATEKFIEDALKEHGIKVKTINAERKEKEKQLRELGHLG